MLNYVAICIVLIFYRVINYNIGSNTNDDHNYTMKNFSADIFSETLNNLQ